jgi:acyl-CoA dehydrogenase
MVISVAFQLDPIYVNVRAEALAVARAVEPFAAEADAMSTLHPGVAAALASSRLSQLMVPAAHGGRFERLDPLAIAVVREALMGTCSHLDSLFGLQGIGSYALTRGGSEDLKAAWLPEVAAGRALAALALTEPETGSDLKQLSTTLTQESGALRLRGRKAFISNGGAAAFYSVLAREGEGFSMVFLPADTPGLKISPTPEIIAPHVLADLDLDDVEVAPEWRLGEPGHGFDLVLATLSIFRVSVAGASLGLAQAALEEAARHAATRELYGKPLARLGAVAERLADSWAELEAARLLTYRAGELARQDPASSLHHSSMAKLLASETAGRIVDRGVQIMGRFGLIRDSKMERLYRQARPMRIYEGASEVLRPGIARVLVEEIMRDAARA